MSGLYTVVYEVEGITYTHQVYADSVEDARVHLASMLFDGEWHSPDPNSEPELKLVRVGDL